MALVVADRVQETTATTGTGTITLAGAVSGFQSFATIGNANTTYYCVTSGTAWEVGIGTYTSAGTTLARTTILASSAAGAAITLAGTSNVFCVYPAGRAVYEEADGSVILNVNSSTDALRITQTGAGNALVVEDSTNPDSTPFVIDASGRVIIGATTSDATTLTADTAFQISSVNGTNATANFICWSATTSVPPQLQFNKSNSGVIGTRGAVASGDALGFYTFSGDNGTSFVRAAQIGAFVDGAVSAGSMPGRISFYTSPSGSVSPTERLRIDSAGNIGIGTTPPAGSSVYNAKPITGATAANAHAVGAVVQSDVTAAARGYASVLATAAASFTTTLQHFYANQSTIGAGSTVSSQYGFFSESNLIGATNNYAFLAGNTAAVTAGKTAYGFYSLVNTATGGGTTYGFYAAGTANNYFGGNVGIGVTSPTAELHLPAGTAAANTAPLKFTTGTNLTTAEAGAVEYNGSTFFATANTAPGRGYLPHYAFYIATTNGGVSSGTTVDAFPANSSISLAANTNYEIEAVLFPNKSAGAVGTIQFSQVTSAAVTYMAGYFSISPSGVATSATATYNYGGYVSAGTTGTFPGFNATTLTTYDFTFKIRVYVGANPVNWRLRFVNSVGTVTILSTSYYLVRALPSASVGTFVA